MKRRLRNLSGDAWTLDGRARRRQDIMEGRCAEEEDDELMEQGEKLARIRELAQELVDLCGEEEVSEEDDEEDVGAGGLFAKESKRHRRRPGATSLYEAEQKRRFGGSTKNIKGGEDFARVLRGGAIPR